MLSTSDTNGWCPPSIKQVQKLGDLIVNFNADSFRTDISNKVNGTTISGTARILQLQAIVIAPDGSERSFIYNGAPIFTIIVDQVGEYILRFVLDYEQTYSFGGKSTTSEYRMKMEGYFAVALDEQISPYSIKDVIDRTLAVTPTRTAQGENKYIFRNEAKEYATIEAPEFIFTGKHLFEAMLDVSSYQKKFPGLYKNEIFFRPFWNGIMLTSEDLPPPIKAVLNSAIDQYCMALDSYVENMVCINDTNVGTVVEPYKGGYISARSSGGSGISEATAIIPTQATIYQPLALELGPINGSSVGDIQSYVYEYEDYEALSDTSAAYPYSKGYAVKYTRFEKNLSELGHRIKTSSELTDALTYPALANIVKVKCGEAVGTNLKTYLSSFISENKSAPFANLLFRPTYIPVVNARVRQYKPYYEKDAYDATLFYNQQSEVVDSEAFGEQIKGLIQKLGNHTEIRVYRFERIDDVPTVGTLIDEKSVYDVATTIYENHVDATICLVDYAELSTYIGVKNEIKTSDISTTKWMNRFVNWEEFLIFTHDETLVGNSLSITKDALTDIVNFTTANPLTCAMFTTYTPEKRSIVTAFAPLKHLALGNSIYFQWEMLDNFAVGYKSEKAPDGASSLLTGTKYDRAQKAVRYCDSYGRLETIDFQLLRNGPISDNVEVQTELAHAYPEKPNSVDFFPTSDNKDVDKRPFIQLFDWVIKKNSAEALKFAAQYHFRQDWRGLVIGSGISNFCSLIGGSCTQLQFFVSGLPLNRFDRHIKLDDTNYAIIDELPRFTIDEEKTRVIITLPSGVNDYVQTKSWGLVGTDKNGVNQLIFGENKNAQNSAFETIIYLVAMQKSNVSKARATWTFTAGAQHQKTHVTCNIYVNGQKQSNVNFVAQRNAVIQVQNNNNAIGYYLTLDNIDYWIPAGETFSFKATKDATYAVWDPSYDDGYDIM